MKNSCIYRPTVKDKQGKSVPSNLFINLESKYGRKSAVAVYAAATLPSFKNKYGVDAVDENGETPLDVVENVFDLQSLSQNKSPLTNDQKGICFDKHYNTIVYEDLNEINTTIQNYNKNHNDSIAYWESFKEGFRIVVEHKTPDNVSVAEQRIFQSSLAERLKRLMEGLGFTFAFDSTLKHHGVFSPAMAEETAGQLKTVIRIMHGDDAMRVLPEEFAHLMIEGMSQHSLVQRLLNTITPEVAQAILGDDYDRYYELYNGNEELLRKEAAGKSVAEALQISRPNSLVRRLWEIVKNKFKSLTLHGIDLAVQEVKQLSAQIAPVMTSEEELQLHFKPERITSDIVLYNTKKEIDSLEKSLKRQIDLLAKKMQRSLITENKKEYSAKDLQVYNELNKALVNKKYAEGCVIFLKDALKTVESLNNQILELENYEHTSDLKRITNQCKVLLNIDNFNKAYQPIVYFLQSAQEITKSDTSELTEEDAKYITQLAAKVTQVCANIDRISSNIKFHTVYDFMKIYWGEDKLLSIGQNNGNKITLEGILAEAKKDVTFSDRWVKSMSDSSDPVLSLISTIVKQQQSKRDLALEIVQRKVTRAHKKLIQSGGKTNCIYELDAQGKPTLRYKSNIDFNKYAAEKRAAFKAIEDNYSNYVEKNIAKQEWEAEHTEIIVLDEETGKTTTLPRMDMYAKPEEQWVENTLNAAELEYYNAVIEAKKACDAKLPSAHTLLYLAPQIRNDGKEALGNNPKEIFHSAIGAIKDKFLRREDDYGFGGSKSIYLDLVGENEEEVLPTYYLDRITDPTRLSMDGTQNILSYAAMAYNFGYMNEIIDALELTRGYVLNDRDVLQHSGNSTLVEKNTILGRNFDRKFKKKGKDTSLGALLNDFYSSTVYGKHKRDEGNLMGSKLDQAKTLDAIKEYTSILGLGLNIFAGISNVVVGNMQMFIDGVAGEFFNMKDLLKARKQYTELLMPYLAEQHSATKESKLSLLIDKYNMLDEFYDKLRTEGYYNSNLGKIIGNQTWFIFNKLGEHTMHCRTAMAILNAVEVYVKEGDDYKQVNLIDQYEAKDGILNFKSPTFIKNANGEYVEFNENNIIQLRNRIQKVNHSMHGAFTEEDKGAIHQFALGRLIMQFRQWMPGHYGRRFNKAYFDTALGIEREGFYRTAGRFIMELYRDINKGKFQIATRWNNLSKTEKANLKRAMTEVGILGGLSLLCMLLGNIDDKDKSRWHKMLVYQLRRAKVETGASVPSLGMTKNLFTLAKSPAAAVNSTENLLNLLQINTMFQEVQSGRYKGYNRWTVNAIKATPIVGQLVRFKDLKDYDYMFQVFN